MSGGASALAGALLLFTLSAAAVTAAGTRLAREGDVIAARTRLGGVWVGTVFLAIATSLPELMTGVSAIVIGAVDIAAGSLFGSNMANMLILALLTLLPAGSELFGRAHSDHALAASLAVLLTCMAGAFTLSGLPYAALGVGADSLLLLAAYLLGTRVLFRQSAIARQAAAIEELTPPSAEEPMPPERGLRVAAAWFVGAALVVAVAAPVFATSAARVAELTGLSETIVGTWMVGLATSLPEFVTSLAALRLGAFDLAVGNLYGSNAVNMIIFVPLDAANRSGPIFSTVAPEHAISAFVAAALMGLSLAALVYRSRRRASMLEPSGLAMIALYLGGLLLVILRS
ncbi:MAG: hypothetical protein ABFS34_01230 [Gemmatimonadota bacterium]